MQALGFSASSPLQVNTRQSRTAQLTVRAAQQTKARPKAPKLPGLNKNRTGIRQVSDNRPRPKSSSPRVLTRLEELKLLSKLENAGLLSQLEKRGLTLSTIESSGLLSKAEKFGLLSAAADRGTPTALYLLSILLVVGGAAVVYFTPDDTTALISVQALAAALALAGGGAAFSGASLLSTLQK